MGLPVTSSEAARVGLLSLVSGLGFRRSSEAARVAYVEGGRERECVCMNVCTVCMYVYMYRVLSDTHGA